MGLEILIKPHFMRLDEEWHANWYGVVLVEKEEHIQPVYEALCEQDDYWDGRIHLIKVAPKEIDSTSDLTHMCDYVGKTDIYDIPTLQAKLKEQGIDVGFYQYCPDNDY
tara:strand:- start:14935 stop:15261 length:327 start_codon:yes stop_codon:yes gene_type:complete